jgi:molybdopterin-guanine dinucleotide biosynthesis protein A
VSAAAGPDPGRITGLILAGGEGRRVGGADKGLLPFRGQTMVEWVVERLRPQVGPLLISANRNAEHYARLGAPVLADLRPGFHGPLAGIEAGLAACATPLLMCVPCDTPLIPADLVARLAAPLVDAAFDAVVVTAGGRRHSVTVLLRRELLPELSASLGAGERRVDRWLSSLHLREVTFDDCQEAFANLNSFAAMNGSD